MNEIKLYFYFIKALNLQKNNFYLQFIEFGSIILIKGENYIDKKNICLDLILISLYEPSSTLKQVKKDKSKNVKRYPLVNIFLTQHTYTVIQIMNYLHPHFLKFNPQGDKKGQKK